MTKVITIAQQKGGSGKTTVSAHLAVAFAKKNNNVAVIDIDPQASLSTWARIRDEKLGDKNEIFAVATNAYGLEAEIKKLKGKADIIIVDSPPHIETEARTAIRAADLVILPVQPSPTDLWATKASLEITKQENIPTKILLNRVAANSGLGRTIRSVFEVSAPEYLLKGQLGNRVGYPAAMLEGLTASEVSASKTAAKEVAELVAEISKVFGAKKAGTKKPVAKKPVAKKKTATKKATAKKAAPKKAVAKKAPTKKKVAAKKAAPKKTVAKKAAPKKAAVKKAPTKKAAAKKSNVTKLPVKKKAVAKKKTTTAKKKTA